MKHLTNSLLLCLTLCSAQCTHAMDQHPLSTRLIYAAGTGDSPTLRRLIFHEKPDQSIIQKAFMWAAGYGQIAAMRILLQRGASIDQKDHNDTRAIEHAAGYGHLEAVQFLADTGACIEELHTQETAATARQKTALMWAAGNGHSEVVDYLVNRSASVHTQDKNGNTALHWAAGQGIWNKQKNAPDSTICGASSYRLAPQDDLRTEQERHADYTDTVNLLLAAGADTLQAGDTGMLPIHSAIVSGNIASVQALITATHDPQKLATMLNAREKSEYKRTPLLLTLRHCEGATQKHYNKLSSHETTQELMRILIAHGADTTKADAQGKTPLYWCTKILKHPQEAQIIDIWPKLCTHAARIQQNTESSQTAQKLQTLRIDLMAWANEQASETQEIYYLYDYWFSQICTHFDLEKLVQNNPCDTKQLLSQVRAKKRHVYIPPSLRKKKEIK